TKLAEKKGLVKADYIRDKLGINHIRTSLHLVALHYPSRHAVYSKLFAPTFFDGCPNYVYRSRRSPDSWGRTVNIGSPVYDDGLPEAVHESISLVVRSGEEQFKLELIGRVTSS